MLNGLYETGEQFLKARKALNRLVPGQEERHQMLFASGGNSEPVPQPFKGAAPPAYVARHAKGE